MVNICFAQILKLSGIYFDISHVPLGQWFSTLEQRGPPKTNANNFVADCNFSTVFSLRPSFETNQTYFLDDLEQLGFIFYNFYAVFVFNLNMNWDFNQNEKSLAAD